MDRLSIKDAEEKLQVEYYNFSKATNDPDIGRQRQGDEATKTDDDLFDHVFSNDLIGDEICSYLNMADMKMASETCRTLYGMVRNSQKFGKIAKLQLANKGEDDDRWNVSTLVKMLRENLAAGTNIIPFLGLQIIEFDVQTFHNSTKIFELVQENVSILTKVHTVVLNQSEEDFFLTEQEMDKRIEVFRFIFFNTSVIHLQWDGFASENVFSRIFPIHPEASYLHQLQTLNLGGKRPNWNFFQYFSSLPLKLSQIHIGKIDDFDQNGVKALWEMISANSASIQELSLELKEPSAWNISENMKEIHLPSLKKLTATLTEDIAEADNFIGVIEKQPLLSELSLHVRGKCDQTLITLIQRRGTNLKKLQLRAKILAGDKDVVDWGFLSGMKNLKDFCLIRPKRRQANVTLNRSEIEGTGVTFLKALPPSLTDLKLSGVQNFWWDASQGRHIHYAEKRALISRFPAMQSLCIVHSKDTLQDSVLQAIIDLMPKLQELELGNFVDCTDFGISGRSERSGEITGVNLTALKGLTDLKFFGSPDISAATLVHSVSHPFLRSLSFTTQDGLNNLQIFEIVKKNPNLEIISIHHAEDLDDDTYEGMNGLEDELKILSPRLKEIHLTWVDVSNEDSDSDASEEEVDSDDNDSDDYVSDDYYGRDDYYGGDYDYGYGDLDGPLDYTACGSDCGHCGRCYY